MSLNPGWNQGFMFCSELWIAGQGYSHLALETVPMWMWLSYFNLNFGKTQYKVQCCKFEESCLNRALRKTVDLLPLAMFRKTKPN
ncbi:hypothetical protein EPI10_033814 [Gossypium australe]|uniref:Uncharacterized protein n=1 Tax=Gossypium australe TaxID=47621 RepID=A0A5B6X9D6_9ROSI|nr:hypothetical protein EPI10_033814 [Gossypium australe]